MSNRRRISSHVWALAALAGLQIATQAVWSLPAGSLAWAGEIPPVTDVKAVHRAGQTIITFAEPKLEPFPEFKSEAEVSAFRTEFLKKHPKVSFRVRRSTEPITAENVAEAEAVGECGFFTCFNDDYRQNRGRSNGAPIRYRVTDNGEPVDWGTGIYVHNPAEPGKAYYAVTVVADGQEDLSHPATAGPVEETTGKGEPILQWIEQPDPKKGWHYRRGKMVRLIYTRWESPVGPNPHSSKPSNPIDYLVVIPLEPKPKAPVQEQQYRAFRVEPAPVGLHLHCWGASLNSGYGWWYNAHRGAVLIASNQIPYDWWTGYHEKYYAGGRRRPGAGTVYPYTMNRVLGFLDWATTQHEKAPEIVRKYWPKLDLSRVFTAGSSMGGSGAPMFALRYGDRIAFCIAWVGVHIPAESPQFTGSYQRVYGPRGDDITMPDGKTSPWDYFNDVWWMKHNVKAETGMIIASNGKSDGAIGWPQAVKFARALQETRRPHIYNWGPGGHGTRTIIGSCFDLDVRIDQTLPAFTNCTLDSDIGTAKPRTKEQIEALKAEQIEKAKAAGKDVSKFKPRVTAYDGDDSGAYNAYLWWRTDDVVDTPQAWEMTVILKPNAPEGACKVDLTPRRLQKFATPKGAKFRYTVTDVKGGRQLCKGEATADEYDLLTLPQIALVKGENRVKIVPAR